jgi:hypothetical protein
MRLPRPAPGTTRWWVIGVAGVLAMVAAATWYGLASSVGAVLPKVTAYQVESAATTVVEYDLSRPEGIAVVCRVSALDRSKARVGTVEDAVPAAGPAAVHRVVRIRTSSRAVTGVVDSCVRVLPGSR